MSLLSRKLKRFVFFTISLIFFSLQLVWRQVIRFFGKKTPGTCIILYYHEIGPHQGRFARQMKKLSRWLTPLPANFNESLERGKRYASVTFCDGFVSFLEKALPELERYNIPATLFVPTGYIGRCPNWAEDNDHPALLGLKLLNADQLKSLPAHLVTVGSHGVFHRNLVNLSRRKAEEELRRSKQDLEYILQREINLLFFPYGDCNEALLELAREVGYEHVFYNVPRPAFRAPNEFLHGAMVTNPTDWDLEFKLKVLGGYCWLPLAISIKRKIVCKLRNGLSSSKKKP